MTISLKKLLAATFVLSFILIGKSFAYNSDNSCPIDPSWISSPSMPVEVKKSGSDGTSNFCDFYQFSWQAYFYLMSPVSPGSDLRQFQVDANFPLVEFNADGSAANSCDGVVDKATLRSQLDKHHFVNEQAGGGGVLYDQNKKIVQYDMRFNKAMCDLTGSAVEMAKTGTYNFPSGTVELKFGWKNLTPAEISAGTFVTQTPTSGPLAGTCVSRQSL